MQPRSTRFAIERPVEYRARQSTGPVLGTGRTLNISRRGLLFQSERELEVGSKIEATVRMGATPMDGSDVDLHVQGVTVRCDGVKTAVSIKKYRLRPAGGPSI